MRRRRIPSAYVILPVLVTLSAAAPAPPGPAELLDKYQRALEQAVRDMRDDLGRVLG